MPRKFVLHIGPAKTGTSSLQESLFAHRGDLAAHGIWYPEFGRHRFMQAIAGHHGLAADLRQARTLPEDVVAGLPTLPEDATVVFSSEDLSGLSEPGIAALVDGLAADEIEVVYYARRWDHLLPSIWHELVKHGEVRSYAEFLNREVSAPRQSLYMNYALVLGRWASVVGRGALRIVSYDNLRASGEDLVTHFATNILGVDLGPLDARTDNQRPSLTFTETLRALNFRVFGYKPGTPRVRQALVTHLDKVEVEMLRLEEIFARHLYNAPMCSPLLFDALNAPFLGLYADRIENPTPSGGLFPATEFASARMVRPNYLMAREVTLLLSSIIDKIGLQPARTPARTH